MKLIDMMKARATVEDSYFRAALLREDIARLEKLMRIASDCENLAQFEKDGLFVGWTQGDLRTGELKEPLAPLMAAIFGYQHGDTSDAMEEKIIDLWMDFNQQRMKILVHCL